MSSNVRGNERAAGDDSQSLAARIVERRLCKRIADSFSRQFLRHFSVSEDDRPVPATILAHAKLTIDIDLEAARVFVVSD